MWRLINLSIATLFLVSCGGDPVVSNGDQAAGQNRAQTAQGSKECRRAYSQTLSAVKDALKATGKTLDVVPEKSVWVAACDGAELSPEVIKCLDAKWFKVDAKACTEVLKPHAEIKNTLNEMFREAIAGKPSAGKAASPKKPDADTSAKKNEAANKPSQPSDDVSGAVMDALKTQ